MYEKIYNALLEQAKTDKFLSQMSTSEFSALAQEYFLKGYVVVDGLIYTKDHVFDEPNLPPKIGIQGESELEL